MPNKPTHGGARKGAGRPAGTGTGRTAVTRSVSMSSEAWAKLDKDRGELSRGAYIAKKLKLRALLAAPVASHDSAILDWLNTLVQQPHISTHIHVHNSQDMGYDEDFISVSISRKGREIKGKGDTIREAMANAMPPNPDPREP